MEMIGIVVSLISMLVPVVALGVIIYIIVVVSKKKESNTKFKLSSKMLLQIYLFSLSFLTLGIAVIGGATAIKSSLSYYFDIPFSYTLQRVNTYDPYLEYEKPLEGELEKCYEGTPVTYFDKEFCFDTNQRKSDLVNGITLFVSMVILFSIHRYAISRLKEKEIFGWLKKIYIFASLILYSIVSIIAIPTAIYQTTNYFLFESGSNMYSTPSAPATSIAVAVLSVPLWIYFLRETTKLKDD